MKEVTPIFNEKAEVRQNKNIDQLPRKDYETLMDMKKARKEGLAAIEKDYLDNKDEWIVKRADELTEKQKLEFDGPPPPPPPPPIQPPRLLTAAELYKKAEGQIEREHGIEVENYVKAGRKDEEKFIDEKLGFDGPDNGNKNINLTNEFNGIDHGF